MAPAAHRRSREAAQSLGDGKGTRQGCPRDLQDDREDRHSRLENRVRVLHVGWAVVINLRMDELGCLQPILLTRVMLLLNLLNLCLMGLEKRLPGFVY
jgi:hypothetical protein